GDFRESRGAEAPRQSAALHDALYGRSRTPRGQHRRHRSRKGDRQRHARRPAIARSRQPRDRFSRAHRKEPARLMLLTPLVAMVRKDLQLFFSDRRSVIVSFAVPIAIASFFGSIFSGPGRNSEPAHIAVLIADEDGSTISKSIVAGAQLDKNLKASSTDAAAARAAVRQGKASVAVIIPANFGESAAAAFFGGGEKPQL